MAASALFTASEDYGPAITVDHPPPKLTVVIASIPDAEAEGARKLVTVFLSGIDEFKAKNPDYSFLLPPGKGQIENQAAEMLTKYHVTPNGPGSVLVKDHFHHDVPPVNIDARARYEAADKEVKLLNAKVGSDYGGALVTGLIFATVLFFTGRLLKRRFVTEKPPVPPAGSASSAPLSKRGRPTKRSFVVLLVVVVLGISGLVVVNAVLDRQNRIHVANALNQANALKASMNDYYVNFGRLPISVTDLPDNASAGFSKSNAAAGSFKTDGTLVLTMSPNAGDTAHHTMILRPKVGGQKLEWDCKGGTVAQAHRPASCRGVE